MFCSNFTSIMHRFRILMEDNNFLKLVNRNFISIMHRFRDTGVFLQTGFLANRKLRHGDFSARGRHTKFLLTDSERVTPSLYSWSIDIFCLSSTALELFDLFILAWISLLPAKFVGFSGKMTPKRQNFYKHLPRGHFLTSNRVFLAIVRGSRFAGMGWTRG